MHATIVGGAFPQTWSNPQIWQNGVVPNSSNGLHVTLDANSTDDLGTAADPFIVHDISPGLGLSPTLIVSGFLQAHDINDLSLYTADPGTFLSPAGTIEIRHDAKNTSFSILGDGSTVEIGHSVAGSIFAFSYGAGLQGDWARNATLILDHPSKGSLDNEFVLPPPPPPLGNSPAAVFSLKIELGGIAFDHADFIPSAPGSSSGDIRLSNHCKTVYDLTDVSAPFFGAARGGDLSVGTDPTTGYHYVSYSHA